jgi:hypothetical protein
MKSGQRSIAKVAVRWTRTSPRHSSDIFEWHPRHQLNIFLDDSSPDSDPFQSKFRIQYISYVKFAVEQTMKVQEGSKGIALLFFNLGARWGVGG